MYWRIALGGVVWVGALMLFAAGLQPSRTTSGLPPPEHAPALVRSLNQPQTDTGARWWSWRVTRATSAHRAMIVDVEAERVADARAIAVQVIEPVRTHGYEEILVYVRAAGAGHDAPARRVQWTPRGGFVELVFSD